MRGSCGLYDVDIYHCRDFRGCICSLPDLLLRSGFCSVGRYQKTDATFVMVVTVVMNGIPSK